MATRAQSHRLSYPLNAEQVEQLDTMLQTLFEDIGNNAIFPFEEDGDLLYYDDGLLQRLEIGAANTVLRTDGALPEWGKLDLASDVIGVLPIASGGTNAAAFTSGQVVFYNGSSLVGDTDLTFVTDTLSATKIAISTLTSGRVPFASALGLLIDDADLTFVTDTLSATKVAASSLTSGRVTFAGASGLLVDDADFTFLTDTLSATKVAINSLTSGRVPFASAAGLLVDDADLTFTTDTLSATKVAIASLTSGRVPFASAAGLLVDDADLTFATDTLSATNVAIASLTSGRVPFASAAGLLVDDGDMTFAVDTLTATKIMGTTSVKVGTVAGFISSDGSAGATGTFTTTDLKTVTVKDGIVTSIV